MPRHTSRDGVDCVFYFRSVCREFIRKLFYKVLRLRDCHAVSGNDDDFFRVVQSCGIVDFRLDNGFFFRLDFLFHFGGFRFRLDFDLFGGGFLSIVV